MVRIDSHQHFWIFDPVRDSWITEDMSVIRKDFLPSDLEPVLKENSFAGCVAVQADQSEEQNRFLLEKADSHPFIFGVVGWVDLQAEDIKERLEYYTSFEKLKGFRHILQGEPKRDLMLTHDFRRGVALLEKFGFTYDILIYPDQLEYTKQLVEEFPQQKFVIDHLAKPYIKDKKIEPWKQQISAIAANENVYCKLSGFVTEADWRNWTKEDFDPYFDVIVNSFGVDRIMFGSDWPVCQVAAQYGEVVEKVADYFSGYSEEEQEQIFGINAINFYNLF
ncbi:MAG: amidohydrolase family protein [Candidatus Dadabacteria bacterium]